MIGISDDTLVVTQVATPQLRPWLVFAILFAPHEFVVTSTTTVQNGRFQDFFSLFRFWVVCKGKGILMRGCSAFFLFLGSVVVATAVLLRHGDSLQYTIIIRAWTLRNERVS